MSATGFHRSPVSMSKSLRSPRHNKLRQLLVDARKEGGWTQEQVAAKLNKPQSFVAKYEGGERRLDLIELIDVLRALDHDRSEEHTSELQSLMRISYAVFCLKKKKHTKRYHDNHYKQKLMIS